MVTWTPKAKLNVILVIIWIAALATAVYIPSDSFGNYVFSTGEETTGVRTQFLADYPAINYTAKVSASTTGIFSAGNPVTIDVRIIDSNVTDFLHHYRQVLFVDEYGYMTRPSLPIDASPEGGWHAKGIIRFRSVGQVWMFLAPEAPPEKIVNLYDDEAAYIKNQVEIFTIIGSASDTQSLLFNSFAAKVAFIFGTFSILLLVPVFERILFDKEEDNKSSSNKYQSNKKEGPAKK